jgi:hypothetical protein
MPVKAATSRSVGTGTKTPTKTKRAVSARKPVVKVAAVKPAAKTGMEKKSQKPKKTESKVKVVRDSFTMPQSDYAKIAELKQLCLKNGVRVKKSELLRAGLHLLLELNMVQLKKSLSGIEKIKTGRPKKH